MPVAADAVTARLPIPGRLNIMLLGLASLASASLLFGASHAASGWLVLACAVGFSFTANTLFSLLHEAVHGLFSERRSLNEWAGRVAAAWFPTGLAIQRAFHLTHHRNNRSATEQFDVLHIGDVRWLKHAQWYAILTGLYWPIAIVGVLAHVVVPQFLRTRLLRLAGARAAEQTSAQSYVGALDGLNPITSRLEVLGSIAFQVALFWALDLSVTGWVACYAAFAFSWSSLQYTDHAFSPLDARVGAWNLQVAPVVRAFFLNYHFHLAHHQRPSVPWIHLGNDAAPGPRFLEVWREAWRGPRKADQFPSFAMRDFAGKRESGLPCGNDAVAGALFSLVFLVVFIVFFGGASALSSLIPWRAHVALPFELNIPFRPEWSLVYLSMIPLLLLLPLARPRWQDLFPVFATLVAETIVASVFFIALPVESSFAQRHATGAWREVFLVADTLNLERNLFPSLHVAFAVTALLALSPTVGRWGRLLLLAWVSTIAASTLLIHEHHVVDVGAGVLLAVIAWRHVGRWAARADVLAAVDVELLCLRNEWQFARRHRRYALIALMLLVDRLPRWRTRRVLSTGFCFLQAIDDVMDGDRPSDRPALDLIDDLMHAIQDDRFGDDDLMRLGRAFVLDLRLIGQAAAIDDVLKLMAVMRRDRCRINDRALWDSEDLREHHRQTFTLSLNLLLAARGSDLRAADAPELIEAFGWCSTMRDLREDIGAGLVNVPADVFKAAWVDEAHPASVDVLLHSDAMRAWMASELDRALALLNATRSRLDTLKSRPGVEVLKVFSRSIRGFAVRRFPRLYPRLGESHHH
jgi:fatty acid desaturase/phytoene/squalene synthetase/membrane-associated phospholipid phosphatase